MRSISIASIRGICSLGSGRRPPLLSSNGGSTQRSTYRTTAAATAEARRDDGPRPWPMFGSIIDAPAGAEKGLEVIELARFAVAENNTNTDAAVEFERVVKVRRQLLAGKMHYFTIEVREGGAKKLYEAKVWVKGSENFKQLKEFKPAA